MRKGYVYILLFSLFVAISGALKYRMFIKKDLGRETFLNFILQIGVVFLVFYLPGLVIVRWYYKLKK